MDFDQMQKRAFDQSLYLPVLFMGSMEYIILPAFAINDTYVMNVGWSLMITGHLQYFVNFKWLQMFFEMAYITRMIN